LNESIVIGDIIVEISDPKIAYERFLNLEKFSKYFSPLHALNTIAPKVKPFKLYPISCFKGTEKISSVERR
jgi:hypothetical protein